MRTTLLAVALAAAAALAAPAPATAAPNGWSVVTIGNGTANVNGTGQATGDVTSGVCSYGGQTVATTGRTSALTNKRLYVEVQCTVLIGGVWYHAWANDLTPSGTQAVANGINGNVPVGATPTRFCLTLTASWDWHPFSHSRCVKAGAYGWVDTLEVAVPFDGTRV